MTENKQEHLQDLADIRSMMERSTTFISLSGLSGVVAGSIALAGSYWAYLRLNDFYKQIESSNVERVFDIRNELVNEFIILGLGILVTAVVCGVVLTARRAKEKGQEIWGTTSKRLFANIAIPLITGGLFSLVLLYHNLAMFVAPATLIFYGISLINASKYTLRDIRFLGMIEVSLGLLAAFFIGNGLLFWALGFGIMHIIYGTIMYLKYERNA